MKIEQAERPDGAGWFRSSFCGGGTGGCVVFRFVDGGIQLRDDKVRDSAVLTFTAAEWDAFLLGAWNGEFDNR
ncbi:DUF397 domain-containing protein [Streptomyces sp. SL13]|uniref:DUF397 domain-containing protein n=1 Tax=Streptantibioticus silvisoli TaxID=2705255 RepID=A0AA90HFN0_9ACTN|nr:DUF397 domain-containing protein [Streptantibioticus silvisoli]MDI5974062.1 DUF397 domain-containing protein [Streptantibioticus silvisoli]